MENNFKIDSASISDRGLSNKRPNNEDSFLELNHRGIFAVADGVGGAQAGDVASQMAMEILGEAFNNLKPSEDAEDQMRLAIEKANSAIYQMSQDLPQLSTMATTIVALHLSGNIGTIGHVGDSRLYRLDASGNLYRETLDHSVVEEEVRAGRMTVSQAANHPSRNVISRALGAEASVDVDMKTIMFEPNTTFLVCSDGITRHIDDFEIRELLMSGQSASAICQRMKELCYERGAEDNLTAVIARVSSSVEGSGFSQNVFDRDEPTKANSRPAAAIASDGPNILELDHETETAPLRSPVPEFAPPLELDISEERPAEEVPAFDSRSSIAADEDVSYTENDEIVEDEPAPAPAVAPTAPPAPPTVKEYESAPYDEVELQENTFFSKVLLGIFTFLIGAVIGAGAIYLFMQNNQPVPTPVIPPEQSEDVSVSSFETLRRSVDDDPAAYIERSKADPRDAVDYFLLGRAYFLEENYAEAKKMFLEAKNRLGEAEEGNATVLANDITAYLAIIDTPNAQRLFSTELKKLDDGASDNVNVNQNASN